VREHTAQTGTSRLTEIIAAFIICSLIIYSVLLNKNYQQTMLLLGVYAGASFRIIPSLNRMLNALLQLRTHEYLFGELDALRHDTPLPKEQTGVPVVFNGKIELKNISFNYPDGSLVLDDVSLKINKGDKIALVGRSGSGKTTFLLILLRLLTDHGGKVLLDRNEIKGDVRGWQEMFGYVSQSPYILDGSIRENIALGIPESAIDREKIRQLIRDLDLEEMISQAPEGLDTQVGEKGIKLSGGQRQRLAIARALYADAEILLLDEITNQLDARTEQEIIKTLDKVAQRKKTIIMITHHHNLLRRFDRVLRLEGGKLIEEKQPQPISK
jgi:ABC-type multidrug transport system fused ATPase/permease subunit